MRAACDSGGRQNPAGKSDGFHRQGKPHFLCRAHGADLSGEKGRSALRHAVQALRIPAVLSRMEHGFSHAGKAMEQCAGKLDVFREELHQAGIHMKSAGRALAGKEVQQAQELEADKGVLAKLRGLFLSCGKTFSGMERGAARLAEKAGSEKSSVKLELRELKAAPDAPHRQAASKEQVR